MIVTYLGKDKVKIKTREANVVITSETVDIDGFVIDSPGEYERKNIFVESPFDQPRVYKMLVEDVTLLYVGKTEKINNKQIEQLDGIDLLFLPCGEENSMKLKDALELSATLDPGIIMPILYGDVEVLKKEGIEGEITKSAKISKSSLPQEDNIIIILEKSAS